MATTIENIGEEFHRLRRRAKLTQQQVATECEVSRQLVGFWEAGTSVPDIESWHRIIRLLESRGVDTKAIHIATWQSAAA